MDARIACATRVFGALQQSVFCDDSLSLMTKKMVSSMVVYQAVVLGVLLYAVETWPIKQRDVYSLESFHHRCLWNILSISRAWQIVQHVSNETI